MKKYVYSSTVRKIEIAGVLVNLALIFILFSRLELHFSWHSVFIQLLLFFIVGFIADIISGVFHWFADTWGDENTPLIGPVFIRSFREHHSDQKKMTKHDWIETNGASFIILLLVLIPTTFFSFNQTIISMIIYLNFWIILTNQIHKWSHSELRPGLVKSLQKTGLILSAKHHEFHHDEKHLTNYSITNGWSNFLFDKLKIYRLLEWIIYVLFKIKPRSYEKEIDTSVR